MQQNLEFYHAAIHNSLSDICNIWTPHVRGAKNNVLFADTIYGDRHVFKFNGRDSAIRNSQISRALIAAGVPVPEIYPIQFDGEWFESYPALIGNTLHECIEHGATKTEIKSIYHQVLYYFDKISMVDFSNIDFSNLKYAHQTARSDTTATNGAFIGHLTAAMVQLMNIGTAANRGLYHHGMTPKNILVSRRGEITGFLDIDEVGICNKNYAFGVMAAKAKLTGMDASALCDQYERMTGQKLNRNQVSTVATIQNLGRNILYKTKSR